MPAKSTSNASPSAEKKMNERVAALTEAQFNRLISGHFGKFKKTSNGGKETPVVKAKNNGKSVTRQLLAQSLLHYPQYTPEWFNNPAKNKPVVRFSQLLGKPSYDAVKKPKKVEKQKATERSIRVHTKLAYAELCKKLYSENTVNSLKVIAAANSLKGYSNLNKQALCELIAKMI